VSCSCKRWKVQHFREELLAFFVEWLHNTWPLVLTLTLAFWSNQIGGLLRGFIHELMNTENSYLDWKKHSCVWTEFGHFNAKPFRYKSIRYKLKLFRDIIKVDSIQLNLYVLLTVSWFDRCKNCNPGETMKMIPSAHSYENTFNARFFLGLDKNCKNH